MSLIDGINLSNFNFNNWDYLAIYEVKLLLSDVFSELSFDHQGIFLPENNAIVLIQNFWLTVTSSIGYLFLIPFYVVRAKKIAPLILKCALLHRSQILIVWSLRKAPP